MKNKSIPLLISLMSLALIGILVIQYLWIDRSLNENQKLIDNKVYQSISNVETQMSDRHAIGMFHSSNENIVVNESIEYWSDSSNETELHEMFNSDSLQANMEVHIIQSDSAFDTTMTDMNFLDDHESKFIIQLEGMEKQLNQFEEVRMVFEQIKHELSESENDPRLDSSLIQSRIENELKLANLGKIESWGIFDSEHNEFIVQPKQENMHYKIPVYKNDILHPQRYQIHLSLKDYESLIWKDIWTMILMSLLFIVIIMTVFIYSIRLVIKHKKISQIKSDFINNMTHEFKTPLASITLAADSIVHPNVIDNSEQIKKYVHLIQEEKSKLNNHVERILEVASLDKDSISIDIEELDIIEVIQSSIKEVNLLLEEKNGTIKFDFTSTIKVKGSQFHLESVFTNVIENSIKYSDKEPQININVNAQNKDLFIKISDKGIGLDSDQLKRVFDNFYRAQTGNIHNTKGFGLGLSYAKYVIEKLNGQISIESKINKGTTVTIKLPLI